MNTPKRATFCQYENNVRVCSARNSTSYVDGLQHNDVVRILQVDGNVWPCLGDLQNISGVGHKLAAEPTHAARAAMVLPRSTCLFFRV